MLNGSEEHLRALVRQSPLIQPTLFDPPEVLETREWPKLRAVHYSRESDVFALAPARDEQAAYWTHRGGILLAGRLPCGYPVVGQVLTREDDQLQLFVFDHKGNQIREHLIPIPLGGSFQEVKYAWVKDNRERTAKIVEQLRRTMGFRPGRAQMKSVTSSAHSRELWIDDWYHGGNQGEPDDPETDPFEGYDAWGFGGEFYLTMNQALPQS